MSQFPGRASIEVSLGNGTERLRLAAAGRREISIEDVGAVWYRRERPMELDPVPHRPNVAAIRVVGEHRGPDRGVARAGLLLDEPAGCG